MGWESFGAVKFDLGPLLHGQTRVAKVESAYNSLIGMVNQHIEIMGWESFDVV